MFNPNTQAMTLDNVTQIFNNNANEHRYLGFKRVRYTDMKNNFVMFEFM